jgi:hypothetical protein
MRSFRLGWIGSALALFAMAAMAAQAPTPPGIYVEQPVERGDPKLDKMGSSASTRTGAKDVGKSIVKGMLTGGMLGGGPKMVMVYAGARSSSRLQPQPMFQFHFDPQASSAQPAPGDMASMMAMMGGGEDEIPPGVTRPQDFALVRLDVKDGEREMEASADMKPNRKRTVSCRVRQLGPTVFRVAPEKPLEPGEYAFVAVPKQPGMGAGRIWDFGVDAADQGSR